jgi:integrase
VGQLKLASRFEGLKSENSRVFEFTDYQVRMMMPRLCKKCGVKKFGLKAIRHMVASIMGDSGKVSIKQIQYLMRHKRQATTENYVHILDKHLTMAIGSLEGMNQKVARNGTPDEGQLGGCDPL